MHSPGKPDGRKLKILILSAPIGSGHRMAANALEEALSRLENVETVQGNVFDFFPSALGRLFLNSYAKVLKLCPGLYALSYRWGNRNSGSLWMRNRINSLLLKLGRPFIESVQPDIVFSTHATPTGILSLYKEKYAPDMWLGVVVTDFTVHRWLLCPGVNAYFLADSKLFPQVQAVVKEHTDLYDCGIPIRRVFALQADTVTARKKAREQFGWNADAFVCLLAGGGGGMLPMESLLRAVIRDCDTDGAAAAAKEATNSQAVPPLPKLHVIAVTGHNETLRKKLHVLNETLSDSRLAVLGFTDSMPQLMQAADIIVTKAGGVSLAECLACGTEFVIYDPLPGQEQANTAFVQKEYGIKAAADTQELAVLLRQAAEAPLEERLQKQEQRRRTFGRADAAEKIAALLR